MKPASYAVALGAALLVFGSTIAVNAMGGCHPRRTCAVDLNSLCVGLIPGEGRIPACLMSHMSDLSKGCSVELSREIYVATQCEADLKHFCGGVKSGGDRIASCMRPHLGEVSDACRRALAFVDAPGNYR